MAERLNWLGVSLEDDAFGKAMLSSGIPKDKIMEWTKDPQVPFDGKKGSLFDFLEDLDYDDCLAKSQVIGVGEGVRGRSANPHPNPNPYPHPHPHPNFTPTPTPNP